MYFGNGSLDGVFLYGLECGFGVVTGAAAGVFDVGGGAEHFALGGIGFSCYTSEFLLNHAELVQEFAESLAFGRIGACQSQR